MKPTIRNYTLFLLSSFVFLYLEEIVGARYRAHRRKNGPFFTGSRLAIHFRSKVRHRVAQK